MQSCVKKDWAKAPFTVQNGTAPQFTITPKGRDRWALECLIAAGEKGCTPIDTPGPRWAGYVLKLHKQNVNIDTITEKHGGAFKGTHARYVLRSKVARVASDEAVQ